MARKKRTEEATFLRFFCGKEERKNKFSSEAHLQADGGGTLLHQAIVNKKGGRRAGIEAFVFLLRRHKTNVSGKEAGKESRGN